MKLYRRILASYLCVCLIPLAFSILIALNMQQEAQKTVIKDQGTSLHTAQTTLESCLADASNTLDILSQNGLLQSLALRQSLNAQDLYAMREIIQVLAIASEKRASYVCSFAYFPKSGYFVSNKSTYHPELADLSTWDLHLNYNVLLSDLEQSGINNNVQIIHREDSNGGYLLVSKNCYDSNYKTLNASLGIIIQLDQEETYINTDTAKMIVLEADGTPFCGGVYAQQTSQQLEKSQSTQGKIQLSGTTWLYSIDSVQSVSNLRYGLLTLYSVYFNTLQSLLWQLLAELVLVIVTGIILAVYLSRRTWSPIQQVIPLVEKSTGKSGEEYRSLEEFSQALVDFAQEKDRLMEQVLESEERNNDLTIWRYLLGFTQDSSCLSRYLEENQPYRLLVFSPAETKDPVVPKEQEDAVPQGHNRVETLYKALERVFLDREDGVCLTIGANTVVVLVQNSVEMDCIRQQADLVQTEVGYPLVCYVSDICTRLEDASDAWSWVKRACGRDNFWKQTREPGVWLARDLLEYPGYFKDFPLHRKQFLNALTTGKMEKIQKPLDTILQEDILNNTLPIELIRHRCASVIEAMLPYLEKEDRSRSVNVMSADTAEDMEKGLLELVQHLKLQDQSSKPEEKGSLLVNQVQEFIRKNYQDPFLNVSLIADRLNRNLSTLSHQYKDLTGHGLLEELHTVRLEAAKRLLKEGKTVRETAELTGYGDSRALIRAFKRYEGSTPGQFVDKK